MTKGKEEIIEEGDDRREHKKEPVSWALKKLSFGISFSI